MDTVGFNFNSTNSELLAKFASLSLLEEEKEQKKKGQKKKDDKQSASSVEFEKPLPSSSGTTTVTEEVPSSMMLPRAPGLPKTPGLPKALGRQRADLEGDKASVVSVPDELTVEDPGAFQYWQAVRTLFGIAIATPHLTSEIHTAARSLCEYSDVAEKIFCTDSIISIVHDLSIAENTSAPLGIEVLEEWSVFIEELLADTRWKSSSGMMRVINSKTLRFVNSNPRKASQPKAEATVQAEFTRASSELETLIPPQKIADAVNLREAAMLRLLYENMPILSLDGPCALEHFNRVEETKRVVSSEVLSTGKLGDCRYKLGLILTRNCHNLTRIFTPGINWV